MLVQDIFVPYAASNENFLIVSLSLLWLLDLMVTSRVTCSMNFVLHLVITLESTDFNATQTWIAIF